MPDDADRRADRATLRDMIEAWVVWRDGGQWDRLLSLWADDGLMSATWQQASAADFVAASRAAWAQGIDVQHAIGGTVIDLAGDRAAAQTKMTISQRAEVHGTLADVACQGRFFDFFERRQGRWRLVWRQPTYERDRMDPVDPSARLTLDPALLNAFPAGYRHLAYLQTQAGMTVKRDMPGRTGPGVEALYRRTEAWLAGQVGHPADVDFGRGSS